MSENASENKYLTNESTSKDRIDIAVKAMDALHDYAPRVRAILVQPLSKAPMEKDWTGKNNYPVYSPNVLSHISHGGNWGITHPSGMSCAIDGDTPEIRGVALSFGDTMEWNTGKPGHYCEVFIIKDEPVENIPMVNGAYIRGKGGQNLAPGSIHPNGKVYGALELHLVHPAEVTKSEFLEAFKPYIIGPEKLGNEITKTAQRPITPNSLLMKDLIDVSELRQHGSVYQGAHPVHGSETGNNFTVNFDENVWHCFRHGTGGGPLQWIAVATGIISCEESVPGKIRGDLFWKVVASAHDKYGLTFEKAAEILRRDNDDNR